MLDLKESPCWRRARLQESAATSLLNQSQDWDASTDVETTGHFIVYPENNFRASVVCEVASKSHHMWSLQV